MPDANRTYVITYLENGKEVAHLEVEHGLSLLFVRYLYEHQALFESDLRGRLVLDFDAAKPQLVPHAELDVT